jgi:hypothetical protein
VDKKEVEVLKRARESFFVRRDRVLTGREAPELPVERAFQMPKARTGASTGSNSSASVHRSTDASETSWA